MRPAELYTGNGATGYEVLESLAASGALEAYHALEPLGRVGVQFGVTLLLGLVVLGLLQGHGSRTVTTARRSPIISICIGFPGLLIVSGLTSTGYVLIGRGVGTFFGLPLVMIGTTVLFPLVALGFVAVGRALAARLGRDGLGSGILAGSLLCGLVGVSLPLTVLVVSLAASLGIGAFVRVLLHAGSTTAPDERTVPPANKI
ncbi:uncharacterized protein Nmag_3517 [Natrialba magadii ATCC 43099]|uniref:Uncharacterized protein n=1 Tax=Natrialba magadii (strain ATCC 43099 / DSM 3394 / CCM 3739 / CIP 104546 / IAM 13178 / JCM 8861 / NBRC 102185 / NCIMB 2190 / MS3) TaxID=547559 RepID=D3STX8_NATMM|nr:hypothetical protein [Natrialba magadii]ADD07067.1 uncharacterized protein Nmag_3517 [Natrialba magadii ATCC 43099]ELY28790.1 hypothetical protein C500_12630 [Natrialba magadii ATCC 43099]